MREPLYLERGWEEGRKAFRGELWAKRGMMPHEAPPLYIGTRHRIPTRDLQMTINEHFAQPLPQSISHVYI